VVGFRASKPSTMGKTTFVCKIDDTDSLKRAVRSIVQHNTTEMVRLGTFYTPQEFAALDPRRHLVIRKLSARVGSNYNATCREVRDRWSRGEDISLNGACLVRYKEKLWLEVVSSGGGSCSTMFFETHAPEVGWMGTRGKPPNFYKSPMVTEWMHVRDLVSFFDGPSDPSGPSHPQSSGGPPGGSPWV